MSEVAAPHVSFKTAIWHGLKLRCPKCGQGKVLKSYLKQADSCSACGEPTGQIKADDGPAWLTILIVGHILAPIILHLEKKQSMALLPEILLISGLALLLIAVLLPRCKGAFIAAIWASRQGNH